jgi:SAM-dependent methyltransferase
MADGFDPADWWQPLYDDIVAELFLVRHNKQDVADAVAFLRGVLALEPGMTAFDQCCGIGTLAIPLAEQGVRVVGVDQSEAYVRRAARSAGGLPCEFRAADAFAFAPAEPCDAAFNWGTGFGNALDDGRNREMLRRAFEAVKPGGRFLLDFQHVPRVLRTFQPAVSKRLGQGENAPETVLVRESHIDLVAGAIRQRWTFFLPDGSRRERRSVVRLYLPNQLADMLREVGFADVQFYGDTRAQPLTLDSPRCVLVGTRPG